MAWNRRVSTVDISWFLDLKNNAQLDMNPVYQRRSVWSFKDRRFFLDTVFRGYPSPAVFLHKEIREGKTIYAVVDGKQRLETIFRFADNMIAIAKDFGDARLDGKKWKDIQENPELAKMFWDYVVPVEYISVNEGTSLVNEVFDRLNRNSRKLVEQELRHAKFDGWFISFVEKEAEEEEDWKLLGIATTSRAKRMKDVQFLSELLIILLKRDVSGFDQDEIDEFCAKFSDPTSPESEVEIDIDAIRSQWTEARRHLVAMEQRSQAISKYARNFKDFYSLWGGIALNLQKLPSAINFEQRYGVFMEIVERFKDIKELEGASSNPAKTSTISSAIKYYKNSLGASTEPPQRRERHAAISEALFGEFRE